MMTIPDSYSVYILLVSNALLVGAASLAIIGFQRQLKSSSKFWDSPTGSALQAQCDQSMINQINDERLAALQEAVDNFERVNVEADPPSEKLPFENAVRMAKAGASVDDLVRTCGLSHGEARLFMRVHSKSAA